MSSEYKINTKTCTLLMEIFVCVLNFNNLYIVYVVLFLPYYLLANKVAKG